MTIAAMKQALECLESLAAEPPGVRALHLDAVVIQNLRAAIEQAEKAEPVAWRWTWKTSRDQDGYCYTHTYPSKPKLMNIEALYTHPAPVPAGWQQELPEILQEAADIIAGEKPTRFPIVDELQGFATMLAAAPKPVKPTDDRSHDVKHSVKVSKRQTLGN